MRRGWMFALVAVLGVGLVGCVDREGQKQAKRSQEIINDASVTVTTVAVKEQDLVESFEVTGAIVADNDSQVGAKIGGRVVAVYVKDGDTVTAGQTLALQDTSDVLPRIRQAQAGLNSARAQLKSALSDAEQGPVRSTASVRAAKAQLDQARAALEKVMKGARDEERRQARVQVQAARTNMETAKREMNRNDELLKAGAISESEAERSRNAYQSALSQYESALESERLLKNGARSEDIRAAQQQVKAAEENLRINRANQALDSQFGNRVDQARANVEANLESLTLAQQSLRDSKILAPFAGRVSGKPTAVGTFVGPGTPVVRIVSGDRVYFEGQVPEARLAEVRTGTNVAVNLQGGATLTGSVAAVNPLGSETGRLFRVRVTLDATATAAKPGMFAKGKIETDRIVGALVVPAESIVAEGDARSVFTVDGLTATKRKVRILREQGGLVQIDGLSAGNVVVVRGKEKLKTGAKVKIETARRTGAQGEGA